jgi:hypothetical protein
MSATQRNEDISYTNYFSNGFQALLLGGKARWIIRECQALTQVGAPGYAETLDT